MIYSEEVRDLFSVSDEYYLAHCISADFALGKGIAVEFNRRFDMRRRLKRNFPDFVYGYMNGECTRIGKVLNLVTKKRYNQKPTYESLTQALKAMKAICTKEKIKKVAMPMIGCGLDKLEWDKVSEIIKHVFCNVD